MTDLRGSKSITAIAGIALCAALAITATGCGGSSLSNSLGIGTPSVTINGTAEAEVPPATVATPIQDAAVTFKADITGTTVTGATTDPVTGAFTLSGVSADVSGTFTFTNNSTTFTSGDITIPSSGGNIGNIVCTAASTALAVKK